jgi:hypothetical protein
VWILSVVLVVALRTEGRGTERDGDWMGEGDLEL